jgi:hypothetical protein
MNMQSIKQEIYHLTDTKNTQQLKKEHPDLTNEKDLRYKIHWQNILEQVKNLPSLGTRCKVSQPSAVSFDLSITDLERSEKMLKDSLFKIGKISGLSDRELESDWQRINLTAQFADIHIEEL